MKLSKVETFIIMLIFFIGITTGRAIADGVAIKSPDLDNDTIVDFRVCKLNDDGIECEGRLDNCITGDHCIYDYNNDAIIDLLDYGILTNKINSFQQSCFNYLNFEYRNLRQCFVNVGDLTGGLTYPDKIKLPPDYRLTWSDMCAFLSNNPALWDQIILSPTSCIDWR